MDVKLVIEQGKTRKRALHLRKAEGLIGRQKGCDFRIASAEVSRRHCLLRVRDGYVSVEDLNSRNGTQLNGEAVQGRQVVRPGDRLRVGPVTLVVEYQLTPEAIDRLLRGESHDEEVLTEFEAVEEPMDVTPSEATEVVPAEQLDELEVIDAEGFQLPETEELRDILTGLEEDEAPKKAKKRNHR